MKWKNRKSSIEELSRLFQECEAFLYAQYLYVQYLYTQCLYTQCLYA